MLLDAFLKDLAYWPIKMQTGARIGLYSEGNKLMKDFESHSPLDTGKYKAGWRTAKSFQGKIAIKIFNAEGKGGLMEEGTGTEEAPWYYPGTRKKKSGKLIVKNGRVWAGGLNPGHTLSAGGPMNNVFFKRKRRQTQLTKVIANNIIERLK